MVNYYTFVRKSLVVLSAYEILWEKNVLILKVP